MRIIIRTDCLIQLFPERIPTILSGRSGASDFAKSTIRAEDIFDMNISPLHSFEVFEYNINTFSQGDPEAGHILAGYREMISTLPLRLVS